MTDGRLRLLRLMRGLLLAGALGWASAAGAADALWQLPLLTLQGQQPHRLQPTGKPMVVNYWASWCGPCRQEIPLLNRASRRSTGKVAFVGIAVDEAADAKRFLRQVPTAYPVYLAAQELPTVLMSQGDLFGLLPYTVFYDRNGQRVGSQTGALDPKQLEAMLRRLNG